MLLLLNHMSQTYDRQILTRTSTITYDYIPIRKRIHRRLDALHTKQLTFGTAMEFHLKACIARSKPPAISILTVFTEKSVKPPP
ncbi:hypothetical protein HanIR_Chr12g0580021 [Helianthus annuus]|nr:hypothetical protein HanIR_Chr12g0580021 [Helianthus annuus]